jgi:predicted nucleotidyltransferase
LAPLKLRDRDAVVTEEGLIFRVFGYTHPRNAYICDVEYAPDAIFKSDNPKALRNDGSRVFYKFYEDEGWKFVKSSFPRYMILHRMLGKKVLGVNDRDISEVRKPEAKLKRLFDAERKDDLVEAMKDTVEFTMSHSGLTLADFGVFGSMLHGFHHPRFSDIDLVVYGREKAAKLRKVLKDIYSDRSSPLRNEFEADADQVFKGKQWRFKNLSPQEFVWHQRRKLIYALFKSQKDGRVIKTEFEPVKEWSEIKNEYSSRARIVQQGWVKMLARITEDVDAPFMPSIYGVEPLEILEGSREAVIAERIVSYMEEFRMQAVRGETVYVEGNFERVTLPSDGFFQVVLTYCPRYYEQVVKSTDAK